MKKLTRWVLFSFANLFVLQVQARVFLVTDTTDSTAITSLRGAVIAANQLGGHNTIVLSAASGQSKNLPTIYHLTLSGALEDHAQTGDLDVERGVLTITGLRQNIIIDASGLGDRIFHVLPGAHLTLANLTLTGGHAPTAGLYGSSQQGSGNGGAIYNAGILHIEGCVFTNNAAGDGAPFNSNALSNPGGDGGAIYNSGKAVLTDCAIAQNVCGSGVDGGKGGRGGGLANDGACTLTLCAISNNVTGPGGSPDGITIGYGGESGDGGGIYNSGTMLVSKCVIANNRCARGANGVSVEGLYTICSGGFGGNGGGIFNSGQLQIDACALYANRAGDGGSGGGFFFASVGGFGGDGGGMYNQGTLSLNDSTISGNLCGDGGTGGNGIDFPGDGGQGGNGGGIFNRQTATLTACTIVFNQTGNGAIGGNTGGTNSFGFPNIGFSGFGGDGGGVDTQLSTIFLRSTLIALNTNGFGGTGAGTGGFPDTVGYLNGGGFNLVGIGDESYGFVGATNSDIVGTPDSPIDPLIGPLQMNGGPTPTHALLNGSPAIDQGKNFRMTKDQRDERRRVDNPTVPNAAGGDGTDIGAFEWNPGPFR